jgi:hypothetical protein
VLMKWFIDQPTVVSIDRGSQLLRGLLCMAEVVHGAAYSGLYRQGVSIASWVTMYG